MEPFLAYNWSGNNDCYVSTVLSSIVNTSFVEEGADCSAGRLLIYPTFVVSCFFCPSPNNKRVALFYTPSKHFHCSVHVEALAETT